MNYWYLGGGVICFWIFAFLLAIMQDDNAAEAASFATRLLVVIVFLVAALSLILIGVGAK